MLEYVIEASLDWGVQNSQYRNLNDFGTRFNNINSWMIMIQESNTNIWMIQIQNQQYKH